MGVFGSCEAGCREERLDLVGADAVDQCMADAATSRRAAQAFSAVAQELARGEPAQEAWEAEYRRVQGSARAALRDHPQRGEGRATEDEVRAVTTWWCPDCGGLEAPQPCLGVCVWRPVEWVSRDLWQQERERLEVQLESEAALRGLLRQIAFITPREGQWRAGWQALSVHARRALEENAEVMR